MPVAECPGAAPSKSPKVQAATDPIRLLEQHCRELVEELTTVVHERRDPVQLQTIVGALQARLRHIELTI